MGVSLKQVWRRNAGWRIWFGLAVILGLFWVINLYRVGVALTLPRQYIVSICCGMILVAKDPFQNGDAELSTVWYSPMGLPLPEAAPLFPFHEPGPATGWTFGIPCWPVFVGLGVMSLLAFKRERGRIRRGQCTLCGYQLSGLNSSQCPECGQIPWLAATRAQDD